MKQVLILALISTFFFIVSCNKITMNSPATSIEVVAPSLMLTGHCSAWTINFRNSDNHLSKVKNVSLSLSLTSGGSPVAGAKIYSDANCTTENAQINVSGSKTVTVYTNYNLIGGLELTASAPGFTSSSDVMSTSMDFTRTDLLAGRRELSGNFNGVGADARISEPNGMATDGTYLYVSTFALHSIVRIHIATGTLTQFAGSYSKPGYADGVGSAARFNAPEGLTVLGNDLYVADYQNCVIRKIDLTTRAVSTAGGVAAACAPTDGASAVARFHTPVGLTNDGTYIYVGEYAGHLIRRLDPVSGAVTTLAGSFGVAGNVDDVGGAARLNLPFFLDSDGTNIYFTDSGSHTIRQLEIATNNVTTLAGTNGVTGSTDGIGAAALFNTPTAARFDGGYLYITDYRNKAIRRLDLSNNNVITLAGNSADTNTFMDGTFASARFESVRDLIAIGSKLYLADFAQSQIRTLDLAHSTVSTMIGLPIADTWTPVDGTGTAARFNWLDQITSDGTYVYIPNCGSSIQRMHIATKMVETIAGQDGVYSSLDGTGTAATFNCPEGAVVHGGYLYVTEGSGQVIRKMDLSSMVVTTLAGTAGAAGSTDGVGAAASFTNPEGMTSSGTELYVFDYGSSLVRSVDMLTGNVTTIAGQAGVHATADGFGTAATFNHPIAGAVIGNFLYILEYGGHNIRRMDLTTTEVTTFAGLPGTKGYAEGFGVAVRFDRPYSATTDGTYIYVTDSGNSAIRKIDPVTGEVSTLLGLPGFSADRDSVLAAGTASWPTGIVWTPSGLFYSNDGVNISWVH